MESILGLIATIITIISGIIAIVAFINPSKGKRYLSRFFHWFGALFNRLSPEKMLIVESVYKEMVEQETAGKDPFAHLTDLEKKGNKWLRPELRKKTLVMISEPASPVSARAAAGNILARLGDTRFRQDAWYLPADEMFGFVEIPAGQFFMGDDDSNAPLYEQPLHKVNLPAYYIGRYPVTVGQYRAYLADTQAAGTQASHPGIDNHPVVNVSWKEAIAYCQWLNDRLCEWSKLPKPLAELLREKSWKISLPSEAEWEKAARGKADHRLYPWVFDPGPNTANYQASGLNTTSPVGCFDAIESPFPVYDLCGNVWEWTRSHWGEDLGKPKYLYPYDPTDGREDIYAPDAVLRVMRGGSFRSEASEIRCTHRIAERPKERYSHVGFRLVISK